MSRIQDILSKAERDGTARRTRSLNDEYAPGPAAQEPHRPATGEAVHARAFVETPAPRPSAAPEPPRVPPVQEGARVAPVTAEPPRAMRALRHQAPVAPAAIEQPRSYGPPPAALPGGEPISETPRGPAALDPHLVAALLPTSLAAEQYRSLRTRLKHVENGRMVRSIAVTSPAKGDGKSLTAANLALTMAQEFQQRILLVDADLRRPSVHRLFGLSEAPGLVDVLLNTADLDQALVFLPDHHLTVLPAGGSPAHPAELLGSATMRRVLETLRSRYDRILIDVPPVAPLADVHVLAPLIDGLLMIVRAGVTPKPAIERALAGLDAGKVLGLVLNEAGGGDTDGYNYEGYGYIAG